MVLRVGIAVAGFAALLAFAAVPLATAAENGAPDAMSEAREARANAVDGVAAVPLTVDHAVTDARHALRDASSSDGSTSDGGSEADPAAGSDPGEPSSGGGSSGGSSGSGGGQAPSGRGAALGDDLLSTDVAQPVLDTAGAAAADPADFLASQVRPYEERARELGDDLQATILPPADEGAEAPAAPDNNNVAPSSSRVAAMAVAGVVVAGAVATGGLLVWLGASGTLGTGAAASTPATQQLRRLLPYASPLFTRFEKDTVLGHPKREALYAIILQTPGVSLQSLCDQTGLSRTAVAHHLRLLELQHLVVSKRHGRSRHYFENGGRYGREQKDAYAVLQNDRSRDVANLIRDHPGSIQKAICGAMGIQASIAHWHVRRLEEAGLVQAVRRGRTVAYFPTPTLQQAARPAVPAAAAAPDAAPAPVMVPVAPALPSTA